MWCKPWLLILISSGYGTTPYKYKAITWSNADLWQLDIRNKVKLDLHQNAKYLIHKIKSFISGCDLLNRPCWSRYDTDYIRTLNRLGIGRPGIIVLGKRIIVFVCLSLSLVLILNETGSVAECNTCVSRSVTAHITSLRRYTRSLNGLKLIWIMVLCHLARKH